MRKGQKMPDHLKEHQRNIKLGKKKEKNNQCNCVLCGESFLSAHADKRFCSKKCEYKNGYHNGGKGEKRRARDRVKLLEKSKKIGNCDLCGIHYSEIKTIGELGSTMSAKGAIFQKDHIIPRSKGGTEDSGNIRNLCWFCNMTRKDMDAKHDQAIRNAAKAFWETINKTTND